GAFRINNRIRYDKFLGSKLKTTKHKGRGNYKQKGPAHHHEKIIRFPGRFQVIFCEPVPEQRRRAVRGAASSLNISRLSMTLSPCATQASISSSCPSPRPSCPSLTSTTSMVTGCTRPSR